MKSIHLLAIAGVAVAAAACTPAEKTEAPAAADTAADTSTRTVVETREVPGPTTVVEKPVAVPVPVPTPGAPVVVERPAGDTTTVRAGSNGIEVQTTNR